MNTFKQFLLDELGQGLVEYALIIAVIGIAATAGLTLLGSNGNNNLSDAATSLQ